VTKKIICRCLDITEDDLLKAIAEEYDDVESLKRFSGFSTGPCEGKTCMMHVIRLLSLKKSLKPHELHLPVLRPPVDPVRIDLLASEE